MYIFDSGFICVISSTFRRTFRCRQHSEQTLRFLGLVVSPEASNFRNEVFVFNIYGNGKVLVNVWWYYWLRECLKCEMTDIKYANRVVLHAFLVFPIRTKYPSHCIPLYLIIVTRVGDSCCWCNILHYPFYFSSCRSTLYTLKCWQCR